MNTLGGLTKARKIRDLALDLGDQRCAGRRLGQRDRIVVAASLRSEYAPKAPDLLHAPHRLRGLEDGRRVPREGRPQHRGIGRARAGIDAEEGNAGQSGPCDFIRAADRARTDNEDGSDLPTKVHTLKGAHIRAVALVAAGSNFGQIVCACGLSVVNWKGDEAFVRPFQFAVRGFLLM